MARNRKPAAGDFMSAAKASMRTEEVNLPTIGRTVYARTLYAAEAERIAEQCMKPGKPGAFDEDKWTRLLVATSVRDENGDRVIPEGREDELAEFPLDIKMAIQTAALRVNGMAGGDSGN